MPQGTPGAILPLEALANRLRALRQEGRTIVQCHGCFDLMHIGHIKHLQAAKAMGDVLVVTVTPDEHVAKGEGRPVFGQELRAQSLAALACVDFVAINRWPTAAEAIRLLRPHYYVKGQELEARIPRPPRLEAEVAALREVAGELRFTHEVVFSSSSLLRAVRSAPAAAAQGEAPAPAGPLPSSPRADEARRFLDAFRERHTAAALLEGLAALRSLRVLVVGEAIIDEYHYCTPLGRSPRETIVTTQHLWMERQAGGALACANHVAGFCDDVHLVTCLGGADATEGYVRERLKANVTPRFFVRAGAPTITKRRYFREAPLVKLFEIVVMDDTPLPAELEDPLIAHLTAALPAYDLVIVVDYGHGLLSEGVARVLAEHSAFLAINVQANAANLGFNVVTKYPRASYVCVDEPEIRLAMRDRWSPLEPLIERARELLGCRAVSVTRGQRGALAWGPDGRWEVPAFADHVVDPMGAGDAYLALTAPCAAVGMPMDAVGFLGCLAGGQAAGIVGNRSAVDPAAIRRQVVALLT